MCFFLRHLRRKSASCALQRRRYDTFLHICARQRLAFTSSLRSRAAGEARGSVAAALRGRAAAVPVNGLSCSQIDITTHSSFLLFSLTIKYLCATCFPSFQGRTRPACCGALLGCFGVRRGGWDAVGGGALFFPGVVPTFAYRFLKMTSKYETGRGIECPEGLADAD